MIDEPGNRAGRGERDLGARAVALHGKALEAFGDGRYGETAGLCRTAIGLLEADVGGAHPGVANVLSLLGSAEDELGEHAAAAGHHERAVAILAAHPGDGVLRALRVQARAGVAGNLRRRGRYVEAEAAYRAALAEAAGLGEPELAPIYNELGILYKFSGQLDRAQRCYERALAALVAERGADDPRLAGLHHNLAGLAHSRGLVREAEVHARISVRLRRTAHPLDHPSVVADEAQLAAMLEAAGKLREAEPLLRRAIAYFTALYGAEHLEVAVNLHNLAAVRAGLGAIEEAETLYERALAAKRAALGAEHPEVGLTLYNLAVLAADRGEPERALRLASEAVRVLAGTVTANHPVRVAAEAQLAALLRH